MKIALSVSLLSFLLVASTSYGQDSIRTRNDKPGTPQSLRTINKAPENKVHLIDTHKQSRQEIYHGATESNTINNSNRQTKIYPGINNAQVSSRTPAITIDKQTTGQTIRKDTTIDQGTMGNGESNATNPIRK